ncbi:MAG TPA: mannosyltransferase [Flavisolibacter sp.]|nr:mannosyltransferase [Flavisolibacter sp.]
MNEFLHIVCLDAPAPPNYGGAIDMFYKIKALSKSGRKVILHYYDYRKKRGVEALRSYCHSIYCYKRKSFLQSLSHSLPYIVSSRINSQLIHRLNRDEHPVLLEGLHCSGIIPYINNKRRSIVIRVHNNEADYYHHLAKSEKSFFKKIFFKRESRMLHTWQMAMDKNITLACLSESDAAELSAVFGFRSVHFIPCFIPWQKIASKSGLGTYCLYHGNMGVSENENAARWLADHVFAHLDIPFIVAGRSLSEKLKSTMAGYKNISVIKDPPEPQLNALIENAHVHVLPSFNNTGVKLKLLHALVNGRFCLTNEAGIDGSKTADVVLVARIAQEYRDVISRLMSTPFTLADIEARNQVLSLYSNEGNAQKFNALL